MPDREVDALANMMGADSRRIDNLVETVGEVKGKVEHIRSDVTRAVDGIDELRGALTILSRHQVTMEGLVSDNRATREVMTGIDKRVQVIEQQMPGLVESRAWMVRAMLGVLAIVGVAVVGLVVKIQVVT